MSGHEIYAEDRPAAIGLYEFAATWCVRVLHLVVTLGVGTASVLIASRQGWMAPLESISLSFEQLQPWHKDCLIRVELLLALIPSTAVFQYRWLFLTRTLPLTSDVFCSAVGWGLTAGSVRAVMVSGSWLLWRARIEHPSLWLLAVQLVALVSSQILIDAALKHQRPAPAQGAAVLSLADARTFLGDDSDPRPF